MNEKIQLAQLSDAKEILSIYAPYVANTSITFEYEIPTLEQFTDRMKTIQTTYPWIVYRIDDVIVGYAYANQFRSRAAFMWDVETSIYLHPDYYGLGIASKLYQSLTDLLTYQGFYQMYAFICVPNEASEKLHVRSGFEKIGFYERSGYKFNKWHSLLAMKKQLIDSDHPIPYKKITQLTGEEITQILQQ